MKGLLFITAGLFIWNKLRLTTSPEGCNINATLQWLIFLQHK